MTSSLIYPLYVVSLLFLIVPLGHILVSGQFRRYFVYFVAGSGFLFLNLAGIVSPNLTKQWELPIGFYLIYFVTALSFLLLYVLLRSLHRRWFRYSSEHMEYAGKLRPLKIMITLLLLTTAASIALCWFMLSPPLLFRWDLYGDWLGLAKARVDIVLSPKFHWFALPLFEIPLFLVVLAFTVLHILKKDRSEQLNRWRYYAGFITVAACFCSLLMLNKQYIMYLLAAVLLCGMVFANRLPVLKISGYVVLLFSILYALYGVYTGVFDPRYIPAIIFHRIFEVYPWASSVAYHLFPGMYPFLHGKSVINLFGMFDYKIVSVADMIYPYIYESLDYGSAPLPALFENYVNWEWTGVILGIVVIYGIVIFITVLSWMNHLIHLAMSIYLTVKTILLWQAPFWFGTLEPTLLFFAVCLYVLYFVVVVKDDELRRLLLRSR